MSAKAVLSPGKDLRTEIIKSCDINRSFDCRLYSTFQEDKSSRIRAWHEPKKNFLQLGHKANNHQRPSENFKNSLLKLKTTNTIKQTYTKHFKGNTISIIRKSFYPGFPAGFRSRKWFLQSNELPWDMHYICSCLFL